MFTSRQASVDWSVSGPLSQTQSVPPLFSQLTGDRATNTGCCSVLTVVRLPQCSGGGDDDVVSFTDTILDTILNTLYFQF